MFFRLVVLIVVTIGLSLPLAGAELSAMADRALLAAAAEMKSRNYHAAAKHAARAVEGGERDLLLGIAELKSGRAEEAVLPLARAVKSNPLLADVALHYKVQALLKSGRNEEALQALRALQRDFPDSPHRRNNLLKQGDILFDCGEFAAAEKIYQSFIETYASGSDALQASYKSAICRERLNDAAGAAKILRSIWLNSPASLQATKAEEDLKRLLQQGTTVAPYSSQELFKRGVTLADQRNHALALKTFRSIDVGKEKKDFADRLELNIAQALLKLRRYQEAEAAFRALLARDIRREIKASAAHLLARSIEKSGRDEEAFGAYSRVAEEFSDCKEAETALLDAAFIRKFQRRPAETVVLLNRLLETYPASKQKHRVRWELAWGSYLSGNYSAACEHFSSLLTVDGYRERALYWLGRSLAANEDKTAAAEQFALLAREFPYSYYVQYLPEGVRKKGDESLPRLSGESLENFPIPPGYDRVKVLISLGLTDDASRELGLLKRKGSKGKSENILVRFYLEIGDFHGAYSFFNGAASKKLLPDNRGAWSVLYPKAFGDLVTHHAGEAGLSASLAFSVIRAESSFLPSARSPVGARGLMQLMPATASAMLREKMSDAERLYDPDLNIRLGTKHLKDLIDQYNGDRIKAVAAYNAGGNNVNRWSKTYGGLAADEFVESIPFGETRDYVKKVLASVEIYRRLYGME